MKLSIMNQAMVKFIPHIIQNLKNSIRIQQSRVRLVTVDAIISTGL